MTCLRGLLALLPLLLTGCFLPGLVIRVDPNGCLANGDCMGAGTNGYNAETRTILLSPDAPVAVLAHELCHAHQHQVVLEGLHKEPDNTLRTWYLTAEGQDYLKLGEPVRESPLEDAAWVCAWYYLDPSNLTLAELSWAERWLL